VRMTPGLLVVGSLLVFWSAVFMAVFMPADSMKDQPPSESWRPWTSAEEEGHRLYVANGCSYCHSLFIRNVDWGLGAERIAQAGDYYRQEPAILGTERIGPDLSQEGGEHPDDWHLAHFTNPRNTRPLSLMPSWEFLGTNRIRQLTAFMQAQGGRLADVRVDRQKKWRQQAVNANQGGVEVNIEWLHNQIPPPWRPLPNPYPATPAGMARAQKIYQGFCINCHGSVGDGNGPAAPYLDPPPLNFTELRNHLVADRYIGGIFYYQIMNGITGSGMPYFKRELESEKIWDLSNYIAVNFLGYTDAQIEPVGIDAAYEPAWTNDFRLPSAREEKRGRP